MASNNMQFNNIVQVIFSSPATVAIIVAYFLDTTMSPAHASTRRDSGRHWWEKFRSYNQDIRSDEFYALPMRLNRFFLHTDRALIFQKNNIDFVDKLLSTQIVCVEE
jgi:hypothetical protein